MEDERITLTEKRFFKWYVDDIAVSLRAKSGSYGGQRGVSYYIRSDTIGSLCATDHKGARNQMIDDGKLIVEIYGN